MSCDKSPYFDADDVDYEYKHLEKKSSIILQKKTLAFYAVSGILMTLILGICIGWMTTASYGNLKQGNIETENNTSYWSYSKYIRDLVFKGIKSSNIRDNLRQLTKKPHVAGSVRNEEYLVDLIQKRWESYLDKVEVFPYNVLLQYPNSSDANYIGIRFPNGTVTRKSNPIEKPLTEDEKVPDVIPGFNAYSAAGHVSGDLFYVNYGRVEDFEYLQHVGVDVSGGICIAKYGNLFRGNKVENAEKFNCSGLVIYSDPADYAGVDDNSWDPESDIKVYPDTWWMPPTALQRGSLTTLNGDPLTPDYPAINLTYRIPETEAKLPKIPVQPISYSDAYKYLSILSGKDAPNDWQGGFKIKYKLGGSFNIPHDDCKAELHVGNYFERKTVRTLVGYIKGWLEPDRYVLIGNHRDAWVFGGADPSSGTAVFLEVSRAIASVVKSGIWRPRRTIVFCSWAAEEFGLIGSTEWTEQTEKRLLLRAVAYINVDTAVSGNASFNGFATPDLFQLLYNVTKNVPNPISQEIREGRLTVYDTWLAKSKQGGSNLPQIHAVGSGSDFTYFLQKAGVASLDISYDYDENSKVLGSPSYHSIHDTYENIVRFIDPDFNCSRAVANVAADGLLQLSGLDLLPLHPLDYANVLNSLAGALQNTYGDILSDQGITLHELNKTISVFNTTAIQFTNFTMKMKETASEIELRQVNDKLFLLNRGFLDFNGMPGRHSYRHVIFAPAAHNSYSGDGFAGVKDAIFDALRGASWEKVKEQLSVLCLQILSGSSLIELL